MGVTVEGRGRLAHDIHELSDGTKNESYFGGLENHQDGELYIKTMYRNIFKNISNSLDFSDGENTAVLEKKSFTTNVQKGEGVGNVLARSFDFGEKGHMWGDKGAVNVLKEYVENNPTEAKTKFNLDVDDFTNKGLEAGKEINIAKIKEFLEEKDFKTFGTESKDLN